MMTYFNSKLSEALKVVNLIVTCLSGRRIQNTNFFTKIIRAYTKFIKTSAIYMKVFYFFLSLFRNQPIVNVQETFEAKAGKGRLIEYAMQCGKHFITVSHSCFNRVKVD